MSDWRDRMAWILTNRLAWPHSFGRGEIVFHAHGHREDGGIPGNMWFRTYSICGLVLDEWSNHRESSRFTMVDEVLVADKIARPCQRCYIRSTSDSDHLGFSAEEAS